MQTAKKVDDYSLQAGEDLNTNWILNISYHAF